MVSDLLEVEKKKHTGMTCRCEHGEMSDEQRGQNLLCSLDLGQANEGSLDDESKDCTKRPPTAEGTPWSVENPLLGYPFSVVLSYARERGRLE